MTRKEYSKYNNPYAFDMRDKLVKPGDTVVINGNYYATPKIGVVDHYTESGKLAIVYNYTSRYNGKLRTYKCMAYRDSSKVVKIKNGNKSRNKDKIKG